MKGFIEIQDIIYIFIFNTFILVFFLIYKYYQNKDLYKLFKSEIQSLNDILVNLGYASPSKDISDLLRREYNIYLNEIQRCSKQHKEHLEFINQWVHQMKTPLSVIELLLKEFEGEKKALDIQEEVIKIDKGLNLALNYARLDSFQKDFVVEEVKLKDLVTSAVNKNKKMFIRNRIVPRIFIDEDISIYSDSKWLSFILDQLIVNGIKYSKDRGKELTFRAFKEDNRIKLSVLDQGVGICKKDIRRVFDKFFTGENGRRFGESTGMGLYIAREVCKRLNHDIKIESKVGEGTTVYIMFRNE